MKKLWIGAILGMLFLGSCAQKKENREEFKAEHDKDSLRNDMGDSAVAHSEKNATDTVNLTKDIKETPTNYQKTPSNTTGTDSK